MAKLTKTLADNAILRQLGVALLALLVGIIGGLAVVAGNPIIPFAALAVLVPLPWLLTRPMAGVLLVLAIATLLPFGTLPFNIGVTPAFIELALLLLFVVLVFQRGQRSDIGFVRTPLDWWVFLFLGVISFAFVLGLGRDANPTILHNFFKLLLAITFFFTATQVLRTLNDLKLVTRALIVLGGVSSLLGLALWAIPDALAERLLRSLRVVGYPTDRVLRYIEDDPAKGQRATGTSVDPNSFGGLVMIIFAFTLTQLIAKKPLLPRWLLLFFIAVEGATLLETSRGAFLSAAVLAGFVGILRYRKIVLIGGGAALLVVALGLGRSYISRIVSGLQFQDQAQLMRLAEYSNALDIIGRYPAFGVGFGTAGELDLTTGVSSIYLTLAERSGLFGLGAFLLCMIAFFVLLFPALLRRNAPQEEKAMQEKRRLRLTPNPSPARRGELALVSSAALATAGHAPNPLTPFPNGEGGIVVAEIGSLSNQRSNTLQPKAPLHSGGELGRGNRANDFNTLDSIVLGTAGAVLGALVVGVGDHYFFNIEYPHMVALLWFCLALGLAARRLLINGQSAQEKS